MNKKKWFGLAVIPISTMVILTGCSLVDEPKVTLPEGAVRIGYIDPGYVNTATDEITVWNWCDRGTKVYFSYMTEGAVALAASPNHKDCQ